MKTVQARRAAGLRLLLDLLDLLQASLLELALECMCMDLISPLAH